MQRPTRRRLRRFLALGLMLMVLNGLYHASKPLPEGLDFRSDWQPAASVRLLTDVTFIDEQGQRHSQQEIFDRMFELIDHSERFILMDMFLINNFKAPAGSRALSQELIDHLIARKRARPEMSITLISDPINHVYGALPSDPLRQLAENGIIVVDTHLESLPDSNPLWSMIWRVFLKPFGTGPGESFANPLGAGRISLRSYFALLNFKANHRKTLIADNGGRWTALISSANPHDASWAHNNAAIEFSGPAVADLLKSENAVLALSGAQPSETRPVISAEPPLDGVRVRLVTEGAIRDAALELLDSAGSGDEIRLAMFFVSERRVIHAVKSAIARGATASVLLDLNRESFGRDRAGIPNRVTARELHHSGAAIRWADTHGEQMHAKLLLVNHASGQTTILSGSANLTRRNIGGFNLETDLQVVAPRNAGVSMEANAFLDRMWHNREGHFSMEYERFADVSTWRIWLTRLQEFSGLSTF